MSDQVLIGIGGVLIALIGAVVSHMARDGRYRQKVDDLEKRVSKLDGINGRG